MPAPRSTSFSCARHKFEEERLCFLFPIGFFSFFFLCMCFNFKWCVYIYTHRCVDIFASSDSSSLPWLPPFCFAHLSFSLVFHPTGGLYSLRFNISSPTVVVVAR